MQEAEFGGGRYYDMPSVAQTEYGIKDVWNSNLEEEFKKIRHVIQRYRFVAMVIVSNENLRKYNLRFINFNPILNLEILFFQDTEFPGVVARPIGEFRSTSDYQYQLLRCNVDLLKIIQVGLTFMDENGHTPSPISTWQFNFRYNLT